MFICTCYVVRHSVSAPLARVSIHMCIGSLAGNGVHCLSADLTLLSCTVAVYEIWNNLFGLGLLILWCDITRYSFICPCMYGFLVTEAAGAVGLFVQTQVIIPHFISAATVLSKMNRQLCLLIIVTSSHGIFLAILLHFIKFIKIFTM